AHGRAAEDVLAYATKLALVVRPIPVRVVDERLTTVTAHQARSRSGRSGRTHRSVVDQVAAVLILQTALDTERGAGRPAGPLVEPAAGEGDEIRRRSCSRLPPPRPARAGPGRVSRAPSVVGSSRDAPSAVARSSRSSSWWWP